MTAKKIGICHYRIGGVDGVSLEIVKHKEVLKQMGQRNVRLIAGDKINEGADYVIPQLEFDRPDILKIKRNAFGRLKDFESEQELIDYIYKIAEKIKQEFLKIHKKEQFDLLYLHNIFTHGRHIAAAKSFSEILEETNIKGISINHDFYISYGNTYKTDLSAIRKYLSTYVPPALRKIKHITINSITREKLRDKWGHDPTILPNVWDFNQKKWNKDKYNSTLLKDLNIKRNDIIILQATRIVERKAIELAIDVVKELQARKHKLIGKTLYNGKKITEDSDIVFLLPGYIEPASKSYGDKLKRLIKKNKIKAVFAENIIKKQREWAKNKRRIYSLWDSYVYADLITYPSTWEGWGNQFIEAVFAKKPIIVFEYPVFKKDIKPEGYRVISLGDTILQKKDEDGLCQIPAAKTKKAVNETVKWLLDKDLGKKLQKNFAIGRQNHDYRILEDFLVETLELHKQ